MVADQINVLREKLEKQIASNEPYEEIYNTSLQIDDLITEYYKEKELSKRI